MKLLNLLALVLLLSFSCSSGDAALSEAQRTQIRSEVNAMMDNMVAGVNAVNLDKAFADYDPQDFRAFNQGSQFRSVEAFNAAYQPVFENTLTWDVTWTEKEVLPLSYEAALFRGATTVTHTSKDGQTQHYPEGFITVLVERRGDAWAITHFHQSWAGPVFPRGTYATNLSAESGGAAGEWTATFNEEYQFQVTNQGEPAAEGTYWVSNDILYLNDDSACPDAPEAIYQFRFESGELHLEALKDACEGRRQVFEAQPLQLQ